jgi:glycine oxidase
MTRERQHIRIVGAGVAGLVAAFVCARRGAFVEILEGREAPGLGCSFFAGGMLAPWCEAESAGAQVRDLGRAALRFWLHDMPVAVQAGTLVVAPARDAGELRRFARQTDAFETLDGTDVARLEPDLGGRFGAGLYFPDEAHLTPRDALRALVAALDAMPNVEMRCGVEPSDSSDADWTIDARGLAARDVLPELRGVKGEMVVVRTADIALARPVRMLHPRHPVYIVPRANHEFMIGATMVENEERGRVTARALLELLGAAYALHPAFAEAEVVETGCDLRPAFPDNMPRLVVRGRTIFTNGLFRHGFLLAPALALEAAAIIFGRASEEPDGHPREWHAAAG